MAFITLLAITWYTACSYASERSTGSVTIVLFMQSISEVGIQSIAVSQATSSLELGLHLRDIRNDRISQAELLIASSTR